MARKTGRAASAALCRSFQPELFRALADPTRIALVVRLATGGAPQTVTEVSSCCGVHLSGVSRHLAILRDAGVVQVEKEGREARYRLDCAGLSATLRELADAIDACKSACCSPRTTRSS
jgi:DNA-binding transcriptional ArsR family regulator